MATNYKEIGSTYRRQDPETTTPVVEAELPSAMAGPLYQVVEDSEAWDNGDNVQVLNDVSPGTTWVTLYWPEQKTGTQVDLDGIKGGRVDAQLSPLAEFVPTFKVRAQGESGVQELDADEVQEIQAGSFQVQRSVIDKLRRDQANVYRVKLEDDIFFYKPSGGLEVAQVGDELALNATDSVSVTSVTPTRLDGTALHGTPLAFSANEAIEASAAAGADPGRVVMTGTAGDFSAQSVGDPVTTGDALLNFKGLSATVDTVNGDNSADLTSVAFTNNIDISSVQDAVVKVDNGGTVHFVRLEAIDTAAQTMTVSAAIGDPATAVGVNSDNVTITIYESQLGYIESKATDDSSITVIIGEPFAETGTFVEYFNAAITADILPPSVVEVSYRAERLDLADTVIKAQDDDAIKSAIGEDSIHPKSGLAFAASVLVGAQTNARQATFVPVDTQTNGLQTGYQNALDVLSAQDVYCVALLDQSGGLNADLDSHVSTNSQPDNKRERRGFKFIDMPLGQTDSTTGDVRPGQTATGTAPNGDEGNATLRDANVDFVTGANVVAGTVVEVTFPSQFAGTYTAQSSTTDSALVLDADWDLTKEFSVTDMDVTTTAGDVHEFREQGGTPIDDGYFDQVDVGDYVESTFSGTTYRLKVTNVLANGKGFDAVDEVPGDVDLTGAHTSISVIRSWGYDQDADGTPEALPAIEYHIDPLTAEEQKDELIARKSTTDRRMSVLFDQRPTIVTGTDAQGNDIEEEFGTAYAIAAVMAKRSGEVSYQDVSNLFLGSGITSVKYGFGHFTPGQLRELAGEGFLILAQNDAEQQPRIYDFLTSSTEDGLLETQEVIQANLDYQAKVLRQTLAKQPGETLSTQSEALRGLRAADMSTIIDQWIGEGRLKPGSQLISVERDDQLATENDISYNAVLPVGEKQVEIIVTPEI